MKNKIAKHKIGDSCDLLTGFPFTGKDYVSTGTRVLRGENVTIGELRWDTVKCWNKPFNEYEKYSLLEGDIVIGMDGSRVGKNRAQIKKDDLPLLLAQRVTRLRAKEDFSQDYLAYIIKSYAFENYVNAIVTGTSVPHISSEQILDFEFLAPSKEGQIKIAAILSSLDKKISINQHISRTLESIAKAVFRQWFMENEDVVNWETGRLGDFIKVNERSITKDYSYNEIAYIDISSVSLGRLEGTTKYALKDSPSRAKRLVQHGDTIWSTVRPNRKSYLFISNPIENLVVSTGFAVLTPKKIPPSFLYFYTITEQFVRYLVSNASGSAYPAVLPERFADAEFPLPPANMMKKFEEIASPMLAQIAHNEKESRTLASLRDSLLPKLMKGEVRVKDVEREL